MMKTCRTCCHLAVTPDQSGKQVPRRHRVYPCEAPVPDIRATLPVSVRPFALEKKWMEPDDGEGCPAYAKKEKRS